MEHEKLKIFDEKFNSIGYASRSDVHKLGYWHETFHCWFLSKDEDGLFDSIYFQKRSNEKKDFPNLLDITAAGHLLMDEDVQDGLREVQEEIGIDLKMSDLIPLGVIKNKIIQGDFIDNEFSHVYVYCNANINHDYKLQREEVTAIVKGEYSDFKRLFSRDINRMNVEGFEVNTFGEKERVSMIVTREDFVPHEDNYMKDFILALEKENPKQI